MERPSDWDDPLGPFLDSERRASAPAPRPNPEPQSPGGRTPAPEKPEPRTPALDPISPLSGKPVPSSPISEPFQAPETGAPFPGLFAPPDPREIRRLLRLQEIRRAERDGGPLDWD